MRNSIKNFGFTIAEITIVLTLVGIIAIILIPSVKNAMPDKNLAKFKKSHIALHNGIKELVTSDNYYLNGDLGVMRNGELVKSNEYFLRSLADVLQTKIIAYVNDSDERYTCINDPETARANFDAICDSIPNIQTNLDSVELYNDSIIYLTNHKHFGATDDATKDRLYHSPTSNQAPSCSDKNGFDGAYYIVCIDIDEVGQEQASFGYAIRADGKIVNGARAEEWLEKSLKRENQ